MRWAIAVVLLSAGCKLNFERPSSGEDAAPATLDDASCPASYDVMLPGPTRYRLIITEHSVWEQSDACNLDLPGASHLVILETIAEAEAVVAFMSVDRGLASDSIWVGAVQRQSAVRTDEQWRGGDGQPLVDLWHIGQPNDLDADESDHNEQFALIVRGRSGMNDLPGSTAAGALCECDGKLLNLDVIATMEETRPAASSAN